MENDQTFVLGKDQELELKNVPVPRQSKTPVAEQGLATAMLGDAIVTRMTAARWLGRLELFRRVGWFQEQPHIPSQIFEQRFAYTMRLFVALIARIQDTCARSGAALRVVLLPGRSFVEQPATLSASYQEYFRQRIVTELAAAEDHEVVMHHHSNLPLMSLNGYPDAPCLELSRTFPNRQESASDAVGSGVSELPDGSSRRPRTRAHPFSDCPRVIVHRRLPSRRRSRGRLRPGRALL